MKLVAVLAAASVAGCLSTPDPSDPCPDGDFDGWRTGGAACGTYLDCDDSNPFRHPGALEDLGGEDLDCDGGNPDTVRQGLVSTAIGDQLGQRIQAGGVAYTLHVEAGNQLSHITFGGLELLYSGTILEQWSGVHVWMNSFSTQANDTSVNGAVVGNAVIRIPITWVDNQLQDGLTTYTFVPDGRIVRGDTFTVQSLDASPPIGTSVTDYVALRADRFSTVRWERSLGDADDLAVPTPTGFTPILASTPGAAGFLCAREPGLRQVGFAVAGPTNDGHVGLRVTANQSSEPGNQLALQYDWRIGSVEERAYQAYTMMWAGPDNTQTPACAETRLRATAFFDPKHVQFDGGGGIGGDDGDLGLDGFIENGGYWSLVAPAMATSLRFHMQIGNGQASPDNLFRITGLPTTADPVVTKAGVPLVHGRDYFLDRTETELWLYTAISLDADVLELVTPRASCPTCGT